METTEKFREELISMGKQSLELTARDGDPFMPKMIVEFNGEMHVMSYPASFEGLQVVADFLISLGTPITGICLTVDTYHLFVPKDDDTFDAEQYAGRLETEFEAGNELVTEALHITVVTNENFFALSVPYVRKGRKVQWREPITIGSGGKDQSVTGRFPDLLRAILTETNQS